MRNNRQQGWIRPGLTVLIAGLLLVAAAVALLYWPGGDEDGSSEPASRAGRAEEKGSDDRETGSANEIDVEIAADSDAAAGTDREALPPSGIFLSGRVVDKETGEPVPRYSMRICRRVERGSEPWKEIVAEEVNHEDGCFFFPLGEGGRIRLWVRSAAYMTFRTTVDVPEEAGLAGEQYELYPGLAASGLVVDDFTGLPVEGAMVAHADVYGNWDMIRQFLGFDTWAAHARTDSDGRFRLTGLEGSGSLSPWLKGRWQFAAVHPDYAEGIGRGIPGAGKEIMIRLKPGFRLFGRVLDDSGEPSAGAMVTLSGDEIPLPRPVLTDQEGMYRTAPVLPGPLFIHAGPPPGASAGSFRLTEETKRIRVTDSDKEVNFGPSPDHVTWKGTVRDRTGAPMPRAAIEMAPADVSLEQKIQNRLERSVECSEAGEFLVNRLVPGAYEAEVKPSSWAHSISIGKLTFDEPGKVERDICIAGAEIRGIVVNKSSGEPIRKRGFVNCSVWETGLYRYFCSPIDEEGRFALQGLPAGSHRVSVHVTGFPMVTKEGIVLKEDQIIDDLRIELFAGGKLLIKVMGFEASPVREFDWEMGIKGGTHYFHGTQHIDPAGAWQMELEREPGEYVTSLEFKGLGTALREFEIVTGRTTTVLVLASEVAPPEANVAVSGIVTYPDGTPATGIRLLFYARDAAGRDSEERSRSATTDESGRFEAAGFWTGGWIVSALLGSGAHAEFPDLVIPPAPPAVVALDLVLPTGTLKGALRDRTTGKLLEAGGAQWWVFLTDTKTMKTVSQIQNGQTGPLFELKAVPAGEFMLLVKAKGYCDARSGPYRLREGETIDVGEILLDPGGILILEVVGRTGEPVTEYELLCNGDKVWPWHRKEDSPGKFRYPWIPPGQVTIVITAEGYVKHESSLVLEPGEPTEAKVILIPK